MRFEPAEFGDVPIGSWSAHPSTPGQDDPGLRGILIAAPFRVILDTPGPVPLCGRVVLPVPTEPVPEAKQLHVLDAEGRSWQGSIAAPGAGQSIPVVPPGPPRNPNQLAVGHFTVDLVAVCGYPMRPAELVVWVTFRGYESNRVTIVLVEA